jgi:hypothetical protein
MSKTPNILVALAWCVIGYWFLDKGEAGNAILASLGSITVAALDRQVVRVAGPSGPQSSPDTPWRDRATTARLQVSSRIARLLQSGQLAVEPA